MANGTADEGCAGYVESLFDEIVDTAPGPARLVRGLCAMVADAGSKVEMVMLVVNLRKNPYDDSNVCVGRYDRLLSILAVIDDGSSYRPIQIKPKPDLVCCGMDMRKISDNDLYDAHVLMSAFKDKKFRDSCRPEDGKFLRMSRTPLRITQRDDTADSFDSDAELYGTDT